MWRLGFRPAPLPARDGLCARIGRSSHADADRPRIPRESRTGATELSLAPRQSSSPMTSGRGQAGCPPPEVRPRKDTDRFTSPPTRPPMLRLRRPGFVGTIARQRRRHGRIERQQVSLRVRSASAQATEQRTGIVFEAGSDRPRRNHQTLLISARSTVPRKRPRLTHHCRPGSRM